MVMQTVENALGKLSRSKFRSSFKLSRKDIDYIREKGMDVIRSHAEDFVRHNLSAAIIENDGRQTPYHGHPVFKAMHATATCCRGCLNKWYRVPIGTQLTEVQQHKIVNLIMAWISEQMNDVI
ncbi:MAG: DUF4186 domain-containing protein [Erysipelotrichaceae bacterium]|nr:DUF4186 domain-containing protein [Erysipelotrichaceae bacterium]